LSIRSAAQVVSLFVSAPIFLSEGEVETLTGYSLEEYRQLVEEMKGLDEVSALDRQQMIMIEQAAETLRSIPNRGREIYSEALGPDYESIIGEVADSMSRSLSESR
jgi:hypothetical protein